MPRTLLLEPYYKNWLTIPGSQSPISPGNSRQQKLDTVLLTELLAVYLAVKHFKHFVEGRRFFILTDHAPPRQVRHLDYISQFTTDIRHVSGQANPVADALSGLDIQAIHETQPSINFSP